LEGVVFAVFWAVSFVGVCAVVWAAATVAVRRRRQSEFRKLRMFSFQVQLLILGKRSIRILQI
jgi:hypothetical protein